MNHPTNFLYYNHEENEWQTVTTEDLAFRNEPGAYIIPVYENGQRGEQTTWAEWQAELNKQNTPPPTDHAPEKKRSFFDSMFIDMEPKPQQTQQQEQNQPDEEKKRNNQFGKHAPKQTGIIQPTPKEAKALEYLLTHTKLSNLIDESIDLIKLIYGAILVLIIANIVIALTFFGLYASAK